MTEHKLFNEYNNYIFICYDKKDKVIVTPYIEELNHNFYRNYSNSNYSLSEWPE